MSIAGESNKIIIFIIIEIIFVAIQSLCSNETPYKFSSENIKLKDFLSKLKPHIIIHFKKLFHNIKDIDIKVSTTK